MLRFLYFHSFFLLSLLLAGRPCRAQAGAGPVARYALPSPEKPVALLTARHRTYLVTEQSVFELVHRQLVSRYRSAAPIQQALATDTALWLGTRQGVVRVLVPTFRPRAVLLPLPDAQANITALFRDAAGSVWVGAYGYGTFRLGPDSVRQELRTPAVTAGLATPDSAVWIATNIGLSRWKNQQWTRYNEEGVTGFEIPDNLVDRLLLDNAGKLWVLMSEGISVFAAGHGAQASAADLPTARFLGRPGNQVYSVAWVAGVGHLFATDMGLLLLPETPAGGLEQLASPTTDQVGPTPALLSLPSPGAVRLLQLDARHRLWLAGPDGVQVWSAHRLQQLVRQLKATLPASAQPVGH